MRLYELRSVSQFVLGSFHYVEALSILQGEEQAMGKAAQAFLYAELTKIGKYGKKCLARASLPSLSYSVDSLARHCYEPQQCEGLGGVAWIK